MATTGPGRQRSALVTALIAVGLVACVLQVGGTLLGWAWAGYAQWFVMPPLVLALIMARGLQDVRGRWWLAGILLSWAGDTLGGHDFLLLLGCFLVAHLCYLVALWPTRSLSLLGRPAMAPYVVVGVAGAAIVAPAAGALLAGPVVIYAGALTLVAILASGAGRAGLIGGALFMVSDLTLALGRFVVELPDPLQTTLVMGTYVPAQVLLLVGVLRVLGSNRSGSPNEANASA
ncbi:lysoplasmalogenase family protein [Pseudactinotalea sp.]|uniref:lysoplasmalogenase family protein n=1 Tax=Pseudactinotalea sp. TaxID=1926260 RepID=UPI003B3B829F